MAMFNLGVMYGKGLGLPEDATESIKWYRAAAEHGLAEAQFNLGALFASGGRVEKDEAVARNWYEKAAKQGHSKAQFNLGWLLINGEKTRENERDGFAWFILCAKAGLPEGIKVVNALRAGMDSRAVIAAERRSQELLVKPPKAP